MEIHKKLTSLRHCKQFCYALVCNSIFNIDYKIIDGFTSVGQIKDFLQELQITDNIIDTVIKQISQYRFYIDRNIYLNDLNLLQFFLCVIPESHTYSKYRYKYNIFYEHSATSHSTSHSATSNTTSHITSHTYLRCFGGGITRGSGSNDFRLLPREHFEIWLEIIGKDYVYNSRTFESYKKRYTMEYHSAKKMRDQYVDSNDYTLTPNSILYEHKQNITLLLSLKKANVELQLSCDAYAMANTELQLSRDAYAMANVKLQSSLDSAIVANTELQLSRDAYAMANTELQEQVKKLKEYIRNAGI
jgi:hypothetical protein